MSPETRITTPRASFDEVLDFANKVRTATGQDPLDELIPSVPETCSQCILAQQINATAENSDLDCIVDHHKGRWFMGFRDEAKRDAAAEATGYPTFERYDARDERDNAWIECNYSMWLPDSLGRVAQDFDLAEELVYRETLSEEDIALIEEMKPYVDTDTALHWAKEGF